jgi:5'-deoxynucleotidase YfbR-like HD superfamily hydrolase
MEMKMWIKIRNGKQFSFSNPDPNSISVQDIAYSLAREQRYSNWLNEDWSVLQHVLLVWKCLQLEGVSPRIQFIGLHHDSAEAYLGDIPTPLKELVPSLRTIEEDINNAIEVNYNLKSGELSKLPEPVKYWDKFALFTEDILFSGTTSTWHNFTMEDYQVMDKKFDHRITNFIHSLRITSRKSLEEKFVNIHTSLKIQL